MQITRKSRLTGNTSSMELDITVEQLRDFNSGTLVQKAFPHLSPEEREFILTGITPAEWEETFGDKK